MDDSENRLVEVCKALATGLYPAGDDSDLELGGIPFREFPDTTREFVLLLAESRVRALNWVCGFGKDWSEVPLDVEVLPIESRRAG